MISWAAALVCFFLITDASAYAVQGDMSMDGNIAKINLDKDQSMALLNKWAEQGISSLLAAFVTKKLHSLPDEIRDDHHYCTKNAHTMKAHAKCVKQLLRGRRPKDKRPRKGYKQIGAFTVARSKREVKSNNIVRHDNTYSLLSTYDRSPFSILARGLTDVVRSIKKKPNERTKDWNEVIQEVQVEAKKLKAAGSVKRMFEDRLRALRGEMLENDPLKRRRLSNEVDRMLSPDQKAMRQPMKLLREALRIGVRLTGGNTTNFEQKTLSFISPKLLSVLPDEDDDNKVDFLSPSLLSLHPDAKKDPLAKATSLADGFGLGGPHQGVHKELLNLVMEASGVTDAVDMLKDGKVKKMLEEREKELRNPKTGQPLYFTKKNVTEILGKKAEKRIEVFEELDKSYTPEQMDVMKSDGFTTMTREQQQLFYGGDSPYADEDALRRFQNVTDDDVRKEIVRLVHGIASGDIGLRPNEIAHESNPGSREENYRAHRRTKRDILLSPSTFVVFYRASAALSQPLILSPLAFVVSVESPLVIGPTILSPWAFVPLILGPRVVAPTILNPFTFVPVILSPLVVHPFILCPGAFNPFVLSPFVLAPFILSPQAMTPLILSPLVVNPVILNPLALSPLVLSPSFASPRLWSPAYYMHVVLSPFILSPLIESKGEGVEIVASPMILS